MLITKKMLYLGFSLTDENFLKIVDAVRNAISPEGNNINTQVNIGTAIMLKRDKVLERHWSKELDIYSPSDEGVSPEVASRRMEIFFDYMLFRTGATKHFLNDRFHDALDPKEKQLYDMLRLIERSITSDSNSPVWNIIKDVLNRLGAPKG